MTLIFGMHVSHWPVLDNRNWYWWFLIIKPVEMSSVTASNRHHNVNNHTEILTSKPV